ncbi:hypothetical protein L198_00239 [Cryptococcus wingfieldii CBS 7118]|uniref:Uncharacterized protein n=1 Tax=Cryptococcus wingfieldii CBS 7118 TaxID=1295528 RepID=A0A1E3K5Z6_9TREE|nr:hypothetical protein L198_00239 [Cryptococcus wingfieldii CBS 7118]ODO08509.1 hypothetical protein L198_00239 [Cryptococcus wingfieldii CBS 7118]
MPSTELPWVLANPILIHTLSVAAVGAASCDSLRILSLVKPSPSQVHYESTTPDAPVHLVISPVDNTNDVHHGLPIAGSIGIVALVAYGYTAHLPLVGAVLTWTYSSNIRMNRLKMGSTILSMLGALAVSCIVVGGVFAVLWGLGTWNDEPNKKPPLEDPVLSDWVTNLNAFYLCLITLTHPGLIITMTYRFEYSQLANQLTLAEDDQDKEDSFSGVTSVAPVCIPVDYPSFPCPITITSLLFLFLCLAAMDLTLGKNIEYVSPFPALVVIFVVPFFTAVAAAQQGKFGEWWRYQETWVPPKQDDEDEPRL